MTDPARALYHIREQQASALLRPVEADLADQERRLAHYVDRLRMEDADRELIARARDVLARARDEVAALIAAAPTTL